MRLKSKSPFEKLFKVSNAVTMLIIGLITFYPLYYCIIVSLNDPTDAVTGGIYFIFRKFSIENYLYFFKDSELLSAAVVTVSRTILGTAASVFFTSMFAYGISKGNLPGRKYIMILMIIPMYISGGLIPYYLLIKNLGLIGHFAVFIIPSLFSAYNAILLMTYFKTISKDIEESAKIDGANDFLIFIKIIIPLSTAVLATIALFNAVAQWQSWFDAMIFGGRKYQTLQSVLVRIIRTSQVELSEKSQAMKEQIGAKKISTESLKITAMVVTTLPVVFVYPFLQKYFVKGIMIGSLKG